MPKHFRPLPRRFADHDSPIIRRYTLIRTHVRLSAAALVLFAVPVFRVAAQQQVPPAPAQEPSAPTPSAAAPAAQAPMFPKVDPANFTAASPTKETVEAFLQASWGFDQNRVYEVAGILKTASEGGSKVILYVGDKTGKEKAGSVGFYVLPDGK